MTTFSISNFLAIWALFSVLDKLLFSSGTIGAILTGLILSLFVSLFWNLGLILARFLKSEQEPEEIDPYDQKMLDLLEKFPANTWEITNRAFSKDSYECKFGLKSSLFVRVYAYGKNAYRDADLYVSGDCLSPIKSKKIKKEIEKQFYDIAQEINLAKKIGNDEKAIKVLDEIIQ